MITFKGLSVTGPALGLVLGCLATPALAEDGSLKDIAVPRGGSDVQVRAHVLDLKRQSQSTEGTRVFGGRPSNEGTWPAQVSLHSADMVDGSADGLLQSQFCGGSIIARQWVLTAAHCVVGNDGRPSDPNSVLIRSGSVDLRQGDLRQVSRVIVHEGYNPITIDNDIALLQLAEPITSSSGPVGAINVQLQGEEPPVGPAMVIGWGRMEDGKFPIQLMETDIDIVPNATCNEGMAEQTRRDMGGFLLDMGEINRIPIEALEQAFAVLSNNLGNSLTQNMVCAGTPSGRRTMCNGDSGGPLLVQAPNGGWVQVGVVSWNRSPIGSDRKCGHESLYGVYTRVSQYFDWIATHVRG